MLKRVRVINTDKTETVLELRRPMDSGLAIKSITGLGPPLATVNTTALASGLGDVFNSALISKRNILFNFKFMGVPSVETIRQSTYRLFPVRSFVELVFETTNRTLWTRGVVESNTPDIFSRDSGCTISVVCPDPFFYAWGDGSNQVTKFNGVDPLFEFPFSNESTTQKLLEFGDVYQFDEQSIMYMGDSETGMRISIQMDGTVKGLKLHNRDTNQFIGLDYVFQDGDQVLISTIKGSKKITLLRAGVTHNILGYLAAGSTWLSLIPGENTFAFTTLAGKENVSISLENFLVYEGV